MIHSVLIFNVQGKPRLIKFYNYNYPPDVCKEIIQMAFNLIHYRHYCECQFIETDILNKINRKLNLINDPNNDEKLLLMYRQYATLYIVFIVDQNENELAILDLIQVFVETMDQLFNAVCELDLIFNMNKIHYILNEIIIGGIVIETNIDIIIKNYQEQNKLEQNQQLNDNNNNKINHQQINKTISNIRQHIDFDGQYLKFLKKNYKKF